MRMQPADDQGENGSSGVVESSMQLVCDQSSNLRMRIGSPAICAYSVDLGRLFRGKAASDSDVKAATFWPGSE